MEILLIIVIVVGLLYFGVRYENKSKEKIKATDDKMQLLHKLAEKGDGESCYKIGREYWYTNGGYYNHDQNKALEYFKKSCDLRYATGCDYAAGIYSDKTFDGYDIDEAIRYYKLGMSKDYDYEHVLGHPQKLAEIYLNIKNDVRTGASILSKACDDGDNFVCGRALGFFGEDISKSMRDEVIKYYMKKHPEKCQKCRFMDKWTSQ